MRGDRTDGANRATMAPMSTSIPTCTIVTGADGTRCGAPAIVSFTTSRGETLHECEAHAVGVRVVHDPASVPHPPTRTTKPFVLVRDGRIVGYADSRGPRVMDRAARLGAEVVAVVR